MPLHYTKSGNLDMRYSSSKAAVASGSYSSGGGGGYSPGYASGRSSYGSSSYANTSSGYGSGLHYKKDGTLDMRYTSSREAASSVYTANYSSSNRSSYANSSSGYGSDLHYKKDGTLDMRYTSSREAASSASPANYSSRSSTRGNSYAGHSDLHYKKDGTLDMRYSSSKAIVSGSSSYRPSDIHLKKDGTPDMRFKSSREMSQLGSGFKAMNVSSSRGQPTHGIPTSIPLTKSGLPDMRTTAAKLWVAEQGKQCLPGSVPSWVPRRKDGTVDTTKAAAQAFFNNNHGNASVSTDHTQRIKYYEKRLLECDYRTMVDHARQDTVCVPEPYLLPNSDQLRRELSAVTDKTSDIQSQIPSSIPMIDYSQLKASFPDEEKAVLGKGNFGVVLKGILNGLEVAVKRLHLNKLTKRENQSFVKELKILALLGDHPNLVKLYGYTLEPPCLVMEYVKLGSLSYLLHYSEDKSIEAKLTDGRVKKLLVAGIAGGMRQLHAANIVHGDLKPANVLVTADYVAKVSDFGLATLRGKTSSSVASTVKDDGETAVAGTAGYMAPELLDSSKRPELPCDVYSFGILLNEVVHEEEPYYGQFENFQGRGPFAAVNYAKNGKRPYINKEKTPGNVRMLIERCWNSLPSNRPTFDEIVLQLQQQDWKIPNSFA